MITLLPGTKNNVQVTPRWPSTQVLIDTRAYEPRTSELCHARTAFQRAGICLFSLLYHHRKNEIQDIFGSNGHDLDGTHIDVSFSTHGHRVRLLPLSVFTPASWQTRRIEKFNADLVKVQESLMAQGFELHRNATESLQIHCDLKPVL